MWGQPPSAVQPGKARKPRRVAHISGMSKIGLPLDKSEGGVKDKDILSVFLAPLFCQRG
jgi:hypothetical protein